LITDRAIINADGRDLSFITVRIEAENSNVCSLADQKVEFNTTGLPVLEQFEWLT